MESTTVTLRFVFKANKTVDTESVDVAWQYADKDEQSIELSNLLKLKKLSDLEFASELQTTRKVGSRILFKFIQNRKEKSPIFFEQSDFTFFQGISVPIEICEVDGASDDDQSFNIRFKMNYFTYFGQNLFIVGSTRELGFWDIKRALKLSHIGSIGSSSAGTNQLFSDKRFNWQHDLKLHALPGSMQYRYFCSDGEHITYEPESRVVMFEKEQKSGFIELNDVWRWTWMSYSVYSTKFFSTISMRDRCSAGEISTTQDKENVKCFFKANVCGIAKDRTLRVVGSTKELGSWNESKGIDLLPLKRELFNGRSECESLIYFAEVEIPSTSFPFEYKFVMTSKDGKAPAIWEISENRVASVSNVEAKSALFDAWNIKFQDFSFHGSSIFFSFMAVRGKDPISPLSIITKVGDWASRCGFSHIQISDIFDHCATTSTKEDLPVSGFAFCPTYLDLSEFGYCGGAEEISPLTTDKLTFIEQKVFPMKWKEYESRVNEFFEENKFWIDDYIKFCARARKAGCASKAESVTIDSVDKDFANLVSFIQYLCYTQLKEAIAYCANIQISVGLDIPFALSQYSAESFYKPEMFMKDYYLGSPPIRASPTGEVLTAFPFDMKNATQWMAKRIQHFGNIFPALRLESTIRYFVQWIVPRSKCIRAVFGRFEPSMSISYAELETWGLWDTERYSKPYIHEENLFELFGYDSGAIESTFLMRSPDSSLVFKPEFSDEVSLMNAKLDEGASELRQKYSNQLLRLQGEVLINKSGEAEFTPRPALNFAADSSSEPQESFSFKALPHYEQAAILRLQDEFIQNKQKCLWAAQGRNIIAQIKATTQSLILSDSAGIQGEICDEVLQNLTIVPLRVETEGKKGNTFDDVRSYQFFNVAAPARDSNPPLSFLWDNGKIETRKLWEEELWESGQSPASFNTSVARTIMRQHCWCAAMLAMFPLDTLPYSMNYLVQSEMSKYGALNLEPFLNDKAAEKEITGILEQTKRRN